MVKYDTKKRQEAIDKELEGKPSFLKTIHGKLKDASIKAVEKLVGRIGDKVVSKREDIESSELQRQYDAIMNARDKLEKEIGSKLKGRSDEGFELAMKIYFTVLSNDANWQKFSAYVFDEYRKIRRWK